MTQSINKPFKANEAAKQVEQLKKSFDAPAVAKVQGLVPAPKVAKTPVKKSGRVVGISADENAFLKQLLLDIVADHSYDEFVEKNQAAFDKLIGRYNK